jgi:ribosomal protein S18 acetylase RimI-like enzyme
MSVSFRPAGKEDQPFLFELYSSTRRDELAPLGWNAEQLDQFLTLQFSAQQANLESQFPGAAHLIILANGKEAGRMVSATLADEIRLADLTLLPEYRNVGIGSLLIRQLQAEGARTGKRVRLHVAKTNRAQRLCVRLGFSTIGDTGINYFMEWVHNGQ